VGSERSSVAWQEQQLTVTTSLSLMIPSIKPKLTIILSRDAVR
jgi:hypothetical protein